MRGLFLPVGFKRFRHKLMPYLSSQRPYMNLPILALFSMVGLACLLPAEPTLTQLSITTVDSLGACQGVSVQDGRVYLYGDREVGVIRPYTRQQQTLTSAGPEIRLTQQGRDIINHPTGLARLAGHPTFIGNSIRLNPAGTAWRAVIYALNWDGLLRTHTLDGNLLNTIEDDAAVQGTRPEYVTWQGKPYVATADYGGQRNEVRLYDPAKLQMAKKTSEPGVVVKKFTCSPWVQNLHWIADKRILVLIQNQIQGRRWRFTFLDFDKSMAAGHEQVIKTIDTDDADELEGFTLLSDGQMGLAVSSARTNNVHVVAMNW